MTEMTKLRELLKYVGLHNIAKTTVELRNEDMDNVEYLEYIITQEMRMRDQKNITKRFKASKLSDKTLKGFDVSEIEGITNWQIEKLTTLNFIDELTNIIIIGGPGVGKTHLANGIGNIAVEKGIKTFYVTLVNLLQSLKIENPKNAKTQAYIKECQLIIIDEFLYTNLKEQDCTLLYHYLTDLNRAKSLIIVANKKLPEIEFAFTDKLLGATLIDRLTENSQIINLHGESYRQKKMATKATNN